MGSAKHKVPFILSGSLWCVPRTALEGGCRQHILGQLSPLWDTWNCRWAVMVLEEGSGFPGLREAELRIAGSSFLPRVYKIIFVTAIYCPREGIKVNER